MRVCLVASEILGAHKNGGIGTATSHLAVLLANAGHQVRVVYTGADPADYSHPWLRRFHDIGIEFGRVFPDHYAVHPEWHRESTAIFEYLRTQENDLIVFQDWLGSGFACITARETGLAFQNTRLAVIAHGPTEWLVDANRTLVRDHTTLARIHMERAAYQGADAVICPSRYMLDWLGQHGYNVTRASALPLYLWADSNRDESLKRSRPLPAVNTFAYMGRLETRKGIEIFVEALVTRHLAFQNYNVVFVGKEATWSAEAIRDIVRARSPWLLSRLRFESGLDTDEAQAFLVSNNCLAVIPSLVDNAPCVVSECLRCQIPFISTNVGGIPELIRESDRERVLVDPTKEAIAFRLAAAINQPFLPAVSAYSPEIVSSQWLKWVGEQPGAEKVNDAPERTGGEQPPKPTMGKTGAPSGDTSNLAVVLTHYERPGFLHQAVASFATQTTTDFELVVVDDGSASAEARESLALVESKPWPFRLRILRQANRYLGAARNAGIRATKAGRLIFFDDDNIAFPTLVEVLARAQELTAADIITCQMAVFRETKGGPDLALLADGERWAFSGGPPELGLSLNCFGDATGIYKRSVFERIGYFHEHHGIGHEDWHLHARAALAGLRHIALPVPLYWYRRLESGMLHTTDPYLNRRIIWDVYRAAVPAQLARLVDLAYTDPYPTVSSATWRTDS